MARQRSLRAKDKRHRLATNSVIREQVAPESRIDSPVKSKPFLTIALFLFLGGMAYAAWFTDVFVFAKDKAVLAKNAPPSAKNKKRESPVDFNLPPQNQQIDRGYNASSGKFPPGALPAGVNLPGVSSYNPSMQPRAMVSEYGVDDGVRQKFTGQIRDNETNLDYYNARYYNSQHGRFTSVDPENAGATPEDPQSWNGYSYGKNNPLKYIDPLGLAASCPPEWPDCVEKDGKFYVTVNGEESEIDENTINIVTNVPRGDGGPNLTVGEAMQQQKERREQFIWNNIFAGIGHGIGRLFGKIGSFFGKSPAPISQPTSVRPNISAMSTTPKIDMGKQGKHIVGHNNYRVGKSVLTANPQELVGRAGTGQQVGSTPVGLAGSRERVDFGRVIGNYVSVNGQVLPTTKGLIHYSNSGIHIVPAAP